MLGRGRVHPLVWAFSAFLNSGAQACSNLIVTPGASLDNSTIYSYAADSAGLYGTLDRRPGKPAEPGRKKQIYDWDSGLLLGNILFSRRGGR